MTVTWTPSKGLEIIAAVVRDAHTNIETRCQCQLVPACALADYMGQQFYTRVLMQLTRPFLPDPRAEVGWLGRVGSCTVINDTRSGCGCE